MTGHAPILAMRRSGRRPAYVWVSDHQHQILDGFTVRVTDDTPELLDLRFLLGVTAIVESPDAVRTERIATVCQSFAARVVAVFSPGLEAERITDTEGFMSWPK